VKIRMRLLLVNNEINSVPFFQYVTFSTISKDTSSHLWTVIKLFCRGVRIKFVIQSLFKAIWKKGELEGKEEMPNN